MYLVILICFLFICFKKLHKLKIKLIECIILKVFLPVRLTSRNQSRIDV